ncbi:MAG: hypothetical protein NT069_22770 [Planctomycetota bacterium]|nr:hypothetical protein [Planctomycetota bacterium]
MSFDSYLEFPLTRRNWLAVAAAGCCVGSAGAEELKPQMGGIGCSFVPDPWYNGWEQPPTEGGVIKKGIEDSLIDFARRLAAEYGISPSDSAATVQEKRERISRLSPEERDLIERFQEKKNGGVIKKGPASKISKSDEVIIKGIVRIDALWPAGDVTYSFVTNDVTSIDGKSFRNLFTQAIAQWQDHCCTIKFRNVAAGGDIRISFLNGRGHVSLPGRHSRGRTLPGMPGSLNVAPDGVRDGTGNSNFLFRTMLHEFGHAIGFMHEHQHAAFTLTETVPGYFTEITSFPSDQVRSQLLDRYGNASEYRYSPRYDSKSVMNYWFPPNRAGVRGFATSPHVDLPSAPSLGLSDGDKAFCREQYGCGRLTNPDDASKPAVATSSDREKLKTATPTLLDLEKSVPISFPSDPSFRLFKFRPSRTGGFVFESTNGRGAISPMPVILELYEKPGDYSEKNAKWISRFGAGPSPADKVGSLGSQDAYLLASGLSADQDYYLVVRPLYRLKAGVTAKTADLLVRRAGVSRP